MRLYLSGPMTNYPEHNYPRFNQVAAELRNKGHVVFNPAEQFPGQPRSELLRNDVMFVARADGIVMLENWQYSRGACLELAIARELEMPVFNTAMELIDAEPFVGVITHLCRESEELLFAGRKIAVVEDAEKSMVNSGHDLGCI